MHCLVIAHLFLNLLSNSNSSKVSAAIGLHFCGVSSSESVGYICAITALHTGDGSCRLCTLDWKGCPRSEKGGQKQIRTLQLIFCIYQLHIFFCSDLNMQ